MATLRLVTPADTWEVGAGEWPAAEVPGSGKWIGAALARPVVARRAASHIASQSQSVVWFAGANCVNVCLQNHHQYSFQAAVSCQVQHGK